MKDEHLPRLVVRNVLLLNFRPLQRDVLLEHFTPSKHSILLQLFSNRMSDTADLFVCRPGDEHALARISAHLPIGLRYGLAAFQVRNLSNRAQALKLGETLIRRHSEG